MGDEYISSSLRRKTMSGIFDGIITIIITLTLFNQLDWAKIGKFNKEALKREQAELYVRITTQKNSNKITEKQYKAAAILALQCMTELTSATDIIKKNPSDTRDIKKILDYIINAKGYVESMKKLGIPIDKELENIRNVEALYTQIPK
jgi:hypothetical protein